MTIYVTSQQYQSLYQSYPADPFACFRAQLDESSQSKLASRPGHDTREEIVVSDDPILLGHGFVFDPMPVELIPDAPE
jgi:hypothetical protein